MLLVVDESAGQLSEERQLIPAIVSPRPSQDRQEGGKGAALPIESGCVLVRPEREEGHQRDVSQEEHPAQEAGPRYDEVGDQQCGEKEAGLPRVEPTHTRSRQHFRPPSNGHPVQHNLSHAVFVSL